MNILLAADGVTLRALEPTDIDLLLRWENDSEWWTTSSTHAPFSRQLIWQYLESYDTDIYKSRELRLMIELEGGEAVGAIDLTAFDPFNSRAEVGVMIDRHHQGRGYATTALRLLKDYAVDFLALRQLYALVPVDNAASRSLFTRAGFTCSGTLRSWLRRNSDFLDVDIYQFNQLRVAKKNKT